jgi:4-carboxymuconolactone decarboxylase
VQGATGRTPNLYRALGNAPALLDGWIDFFWRLRADCTTSRGLRELLILRVAQLTNAPYEWAAHYGMATAEGISDATLAELADWRSSEAFSPFERAALAMADELTDAGEVSDATWAELRPFVDDQAAVELVLTVAGYACVSRTLLALRVPLEGQMLANLPLPRPSR